VRGLWLAAPLLAACATGDLVAPADASLELPSPDAAANDVPADGSPDLAPEAAPAPLCASDDRCGPSDHCDLASMTCAPGCHRDEGCARPTPRCDVAAHACAACLAAADCPSGHRCTERRCEEVRCPEGFADCDLQASNGCEANLTTDPMHCGACGRRPAETCDARDDNCNGRCDDVDGCRVPVHRTNGVEHFYTLNEAEAVGAGFTVETRNYFWLMERPAAGVVPLYRCYNARQGRHFMTTAPDCDGAAIEGVMGHIATSALCGAAPLYRLRNSTSNDNFYTLSAAERDNAVMRYGYTALELAGYVWTAPRG